MIDLTSVFNALIALAAALIVRYVIPWVKGNTTARQREHLMAWARVAVAAAQQLYHQADGETRLNYALELMGEQGFDVNTGAVRDAIEAEVLRLHLELEVSGR